MKSGQLIESSKRTIFLPKSCRKWGRETSFRFLKKPYEIKGNGLELSFSLIWLILNLNLRYDKNKLYGNLDYWSRDLLNFSFLEKGLGIVFPSHFMYDFSTKTSLCSSSWPNFIVWLPLLLEILGIIACTKKYLQSDWLRGVQYWPYLYSVFNICTLWLNKKKENTTFEFRNGKIEMCSLKTN